MLVALNRLLPEGLKNDKMLFLNTSEEGELLMLISNLYNSIIVDGKREFWKKKQLETNCGTLLIWFDLVLYTLLQEGIESNKKHGISNS